VISQNGNGYDAGFVESFWKTVWDCQSDQTTDTEAAVRQFLTLEATRWQYLTGVPDETLVDPESWYHDYALLSRPGNEIFGPAGAQAFADDLPDAEIHVLDGGHFLLESALDETAALIRTFLAKHVAA
jgi:hypothetical protein